MANSQESKPLDLIEQLREHNVVDLTIIPTPGALIYFNDGESAPVTFFPDKFIGRSLLFKQNFEPYLSQIIWHLVNQLGLTNISLFDVGANIGIFSRQMKNQLGDRLVTINAFEPSPDNFSLLEMNLGFIPGVVLHEYGLSDEDATIELNMDSMNTGNYSFLKSAVTEEEFGGVQQAQVRNGRDVIEKISKDLPGPYIYKSDTQGFDQFIACTFDFSFWDKVSIAVFELWRLPSPKQYDVEKFKKILSSFDNLRFVGRSNVLISVGDVIEYLSHTDYEHDDLIAWNN